MVFDDVTAAVNGHRLADHFARLAIFDVQSDLRINTHAARHFHSGPRRFYFHGFKARSTSVTQIINSETSNVTKLTNYYRI